MVEALHPVPLRGGNDHRKWWRQQAETVAFRLFSEIEKGEYREEVETSATMMSICKTDNGRRWSAAVSTNGFGPFWDVRSSFSENWSDGSIEGSEGSRTVALQGPKSVIGAATTVLGG
ncbi:hypothetical protein V6N13_028303 [Hibiscus sabdariffa]